MHGKVGLVLVIAPILALAADAPESRSDADRLLAAQPAALRERLFDEKLVIMQERRESGTPSGGFTVGLVIFEVPVADAFALLCQTERQIEYRPEVVGIETVERGPLGPVDEHRLKVLFRRYVYRLQYALEPQSHSLRWELAPGFEHDLERVSGFWELHALDEERTLGRFGSSVDVGPLVPAFLQDLISREKLPDVMERTRRWVDAEHRARR